MLEKLLIIVGTIFIVYYSLIAIYVGNYTGFALIWLATGVFFVVSGILLLKTDFFQKLFSNKIIKGGTIFTIGALLLLFVVIECIIIYNANSYPKEESEYIVVLGAGIKGETITKALKFRLDAAKEYLDEHPDTKVVVSGGQGPQEDISEALAMYRYLVREGIDSEKIIMEDKSTDTNENIIFTKKIIGENSNIIVVSNGFHVFRATSLAKSNGFSKVQGLGAKTDLFLLPNHYVREAVAIVKDISFGNIKIFKNR